MNFQLTNILNGSRELIHRLVSMLLCDHAGDTDCACGHNRKKDSDPHHFQFGCFFFWQSLFKA